MRSDQTLSKHEHDEAGRPVGTRAERAVVVRKRILAAAREGGRWEYLDLGEGRQARVWAVDLGGGMEAWVSTRFSGLPDASGPTALMPATQMHRTPPFADDTLIDLSVEPLGKVLSVATRDDRVRVVGFTPGPWEERFGLPARDWSPAVQRKLAARASR